MAKITKRTVDALAGQERERVVWDDDLKGFGVRVHPSGRKVYIVKTRYRGRVIKMTIGPHGAVTPSYMRDTPYQANRTLGVLSKMFNLAELWDLRPDGSNPCRHVRRFREEKRERFLSDVEYQRLGEALKAIEVDGSETASAIAAVRLLMLTGCRLSEIQKLRWEHVDLGASELRLPDTKTGAKVVYLGDPAIAVLEQFDRRDGNPWVIAGRKPGNHLTDLQHPWRRIRARAGLDDVRIHDLRHTCASSPYFLAAKELINHGNTVCFVQFLEPPQHRPL